MCKPFGLWRSEDSGKTWNRIDKGDIAGGWARSYSISVDSERGGRYAAFRTSPPGPENGTAKSAWTIDGGKTWTDITSRKPDMYAQYAGWTHGAVDWSKDIPTNIVAHSHSGSNLHHSVDSGKEWKELRPAGRISIDLKSVNRKMGGYGIYGDTVYFGNITGIFSGTGKSEKTEKASNYRIVGTIMQNYGSKLYWLTDESVIVSKDIGKSWKEIGSTLPSPARKGPYFGKTEAEMMVVCEDGLYITINGCSSWKKMSGLFFDKTTYRADKDGYQIEKHDYAWDSVNKAIFAAGQAGSLYRMKIK
jgi:hypothetical protein